ncbi:MULTISPECIES: hypothetical protein [Clostridium]|uniref:hypothetical protein n=1 Tax=Clostridium TaxID=1485 RepID=UPI00192E4145|nr:MULTISPECIES: hypothetical protein [Clostridium]MBY6842222.1 hypothetical protein [Clostridium botulinum]MCW6079292.1 hypothetical protein [Clostridium sporogenes]
MEKQIHNLLKQFKEKEKEEILNCVVNKLHILKTSTSINSYNIVSTKKEVNKNGF